MGLKYDNPGNDPVLDGIKEIGGRIDEIKQEHKNDTDQLQSRYDELALRFDRMEAKGLKQPIADNTTLEGQISNVIATNHKSIIDIKEGSQSRVQFKALPMLSTTHITGGGVNTYGKFVPNVGAAIHARDVIPSVVSSTATWIDYVEGTQTGSVAFQTEGATKAELEFVYEAKQVKAEYLAGVTKFSKQLASNLPFLRSALITQLSREFYKAEDSYIATQLTTAATGYTSAATDDVEAIIDTIAGRLAAGYETDVILLNHVQYARLLKAMFTNGNYYGSGSVVGTPGGGISIWSTPIVPVGWVGDDKGLFIDRSFVKRVVVEPLNIQFSEHDGDNFVKNNITARIEEQEAVSVLKGAAISYIDFGNVA